VWVRTAQATEFVADDIRVDLGSDEFRQMETIQPISIRWSLELEMREWGVKSTYVSVPDQDITLVYQIEKDLGNDDFEYVDQEKTIHLTNVQAEFENARWSHSLVPTALSEYGGKWTLEFSFVN